MKKVLLITPKSKTIPKLDDYDYVGVDAGALLVLKEGFPLLFAIGDFDSMSDTDYVYLSRHCDQIYKHPIQKNETDSELAVRTCKEMGYEHIVLWGGISGRLDHTMINILLLLHREKDLILMDERQKVSLLSKGQHLLQANYKHVSFFALEKTMISLSHFLYPLDHQIINTDDLYLSSNQIIDKQGQVDIEFGKVLCIESNLQ